MFVLRSMFVLRTFVLRTFVLRSIFVLRTFVTVVHRGVAMGGVAFSRPSDAKNASSVAGSTNGSGGQGPPSPPARRLALRSRWRDPRLAAGIGLVACSVVAGSWVVASADDRVTVWAAARDLASGTEVRVDDLTAVSVRLDAASQYLAASSTEVFGRRVVRSIASGELVPVSAIGTSTTPRRLVTVPVEPMHAPTGLAHGDLVDIYVSPRDAAFDGGQSRLVLGNALVADANVNTDSASGEIAVVIDVTPEQAAALVSAGRSGVIDLVRVPMSTK